MYNLPKSRGPRTCTTTSAASRCSNPLSGVWPGSDEPATFFISQTRGAAEWDATRVRKER